MVVSTDLFKGSTLAASETLSDHERSALDAEGIDRVVKVGGPEARLDACHDGMFCRHDVVDLTGIVTVVAAVGCSKVTGWESPVLGRQLGLLGEIEEVGGGADGDEGFVAEVLVERFVLGFFEVHKTKGENQKIGLGQVLGEIREVVGIRAAV